jgi:hypothetical protein
MCICTNALALLHRLLASSASLVRRGPSRFGHRKPFGEIFGKLRRKNEFLVGF